jgi:hypothetical protein
MSVVPVGYANETRSFYGNNDTFFQSAAASFTVVDNNNVVPVALSFIQAGVQYQVAYQVSLASDNASPAPASLLSFSVGDTTGIFYEVPVVSLSAVEPLLVTNPIVFQGSQIYTAITDGNLDVNVFLNRDVGDLNVYTADIVTWVKPVAQNLPF